MQKYSRFDAHPHNFAGPQKYLDQFLKFEGSVPRQFYSHPTLLCPFRLLSKTKSQSLFLRKLRSRKCNYQKLLLQFLLLYYLPEGYLPYGLEISLRLNGYRVNSIHMRHFQKQIFLHDQREKNHQIQYEKASYFKPYHSNVGSLENSGHYPDRVNQLLQSSFPHQFWKASTPVFLRVKHQQTVLLKRRLVVAGRQKREKSETALRLIRYQQSIVLGYRQGQIISHCPNIVY